MDGCGTMTTSSEAPLRGSMVSMVDMKVGYRTHGRVGGVTVILVGRPEGALGFEKKPRPSVVTGKVSSPTATVAPAMPLPR